MQSNPTNLFIEIFRSYYFFDISLPHLINYLASHLRALRNAFTLKSHHRIYLTVSTGRARHRSKHRAQHRARHRLQSRQPSIHQPSRPINSSASAHFGKRFPNLSPDSTNNQRMLAYASGKIRCKTLATFLHYPYWKFKNFIIFVPSHKP